jgi:gas vesicle protein
MGQEADRIRAEIEQTRADMTDTVDALGYKADVPSRAKEKIVGVKDKITGSTPDSADVKHKARRGANLAQENPLGLALGSVAVGFIAGMLIPSTQIEDQKLGESSDQLIEKAKQTGQEALEHGKQVAQDAAQTAKQSGQEHAQQVKDNAQETASPAPTYQAT